MSTRKCSSASCTTESPTLKQCSACKKAWYCSPECQKFDWTLHIFDCKTGKPIDTVYYLARSVYNMDLFPLDTQTRVDYGFRKANLLLGDEESETMLCGLWRGVLVDHKISPQEIRKWRRDGKMIERIKELYETLPPSNRGGYYPWFLEHQYVLDGSPVEEDLAERTARQSADKVLQDAWNYVGGPGNISADEIRKQISRLPPKRQACATLCALAVSNKHPHPSMDLWMSFGFVAAREQGDELELGRKYSELIKRCTFDEFCAAFESRSVPQLFQSHGISVFPSEAFNEPSSLSTTRLFYDVMSGSPSLFKSVWNLKQYVDQLVATVSDTDTPPHPIPSVACDYGFFNCKKPSEWKLLNDIYKELFTKHGDGMDPLDLHAACIKGELLEYVKKFVKLSPNTAKFTRLLKNPYPLPEF